MNEVYGAGPIRSPPGHPRPVDPSRHRRRRHPRLRHRATPPADLARRGSGAAGFALSRSAPARKPRAADRGVEAVGHGSRVEVLSPHGQGSTPAERRGGQLASLDGGDRPDPQDRGGIAMTWWRRMLRRRVLERELDAELRDHIEREVAEGVRAGQSEADVRRQIRLTSGGLDQVKEECRDVRRPPALADLGADLRFAWRILAKDRWFTAGAVLTLALAMGVANTTFIMTYAALMRDLPFERPERVAMVRTLDGRGREGGVSYPDFEDFRRDSRVFDGRAAAFAGGTISLGRDGAAPEQFDGLYVSADTFTVLRVRPILGRDFSAADDRPGAEAVAIIGSNIWKGRYGGSRDVLGRKVSVNGTTPATIIGVMPAGFHFVDSADVWLPISQMAGQTLQRRDTRVLLMIGRLPDGISLERVRADLSPIAATLAVAHPETNKDIRPLVDSLDEAFNGGMGLTDSFIFMPLLAAAFVLLIAAANMANLLLARAAHRSREIAIRLAIGATQWRIVRGLLIESLLLA